MDEPEHAGPAAAGMLKVYLARRDEPCPNCGYNLRGLGADRCPECDQRLVLSVQLEEPQTGALIAAVVGLVFAAAPGAALLGLVLLTSLSKGLPAPFERFWLLWYPLLVCVVWSLAAGVLGSRRGRRWFRSLEPGGARVVLFVAWASSLVAGVTFLVGVWQQL